MTSPILRLLNVSVDYPSGAGRYRAADEANLELQSGQVLGLVGESGSGKTTLARAVLGLLPPIAQVSGQIIFNGTDLLQLSNTEMERIRGKHIATVFQDPLTSLNPAIPVGDQVAEALEIHARVPRRAAREEAVRYLTKVGIPLARMHAEFYPHQLSGGMLQRIVIATALTCNPKLLILDEPTTALDVTVEAEILQLVRQLNEEYQSAVLFITHDLRVVREVCDSVAVMYAGQVVEIAPVDEFFRQPLHPYSKGLLVATPSLSTGKSSAKLHSIPGKLPKGPVAGCIFHPRCPFAVELCRTAAPLLRYDHGRWSRCWRSEELSNVSWALTRPDSGAIELLNPVPEAQTRPILEVKNLSKRYGARDKLWSRLLRIKSSKGWAVKDVSFAVPEGKTLSLVGETGCGKTTVARCLVGLTAPTGGDIYFRGKNVTFHDRTQEREYQRLVQIVFQDPDSSLNPRHRVGEIIRRPLNLYGLARGYAAEQRLAQLLDQVQLPPAYASRYPHELSGGEKQRVAIARALAAEPAIVILDEPVTALDVSVQAAILNLLVELQRRSGLSYMLVAHDLSVVRYISDKVAVMYRGQICEVGTTDQVFSAPYHPYTALLLSSIPAPNFQRRGIAPPGFPVDQAEESPGCRFFHRCSRRIIGLCDVVTPPEVKIAPGHQIFCHADFEKAEVHGVALRLPPSQVNY